MALFVGASIIGEKYCPFVHGPRSNNVWHLEVFSCCAVPGGQRHSADDVPIFVAVELLPIGLSSIVSGHG